MEKDNKSLNVFKFFKSLLMINIIILVLFLVHFVRNIVILNDLTEKGSIYNYSNNFYALCFFFNISVKQFILYIFIPIFFSSSFITLIIFLFLYCI